MNDRARKRYRDTSRTTWAALANNRKNTQKAEKFLESSQTKNKVAIPATTLPNNTPTPIIAVATAEPWFEGDPLPLGAGVGAGGEEPPPDPPPSTKSGFTVSWMEVVTVAPPWSTSPTQSATPELIAHEMLISSSGMEAYTTASEGPWTIVAM